MLYHHSMNEWQHTQDHEMEFWNDCTKTYIEETKQFFYATRMKLGFVDYPLSDIDFQGKTVLDIGSGPTSILLKSKNYSRATVLDPLMDRFPEWVRSRYASVGIERLAIPAENLDVNRQYDEVLIYNVLQHTIDPELIIKKALAVGKVVRIFEWVKVPTDEKHPHYLEAEKLDKWLGKKGIVERVNEPYMFSAECYYNVVETQA